VLGVAFIIECQRELAHWSFAMNINTKPALRLATRLLCCLLLTVPQLWASELTIEAATEIAVSHDPGSRAWIEASKSTAAAAAAAGELPDPMLMIGAMNLPIDTFDLDQEPMTQVQLGVRQMFPPGKTRQWERSALTASSRASLARAEARGREVRKLVRLAWLDAYYWQQAELIVLDNEKLFEQLVQVAESMYQTGLGSQADIHRAQLGVSQLENRLHELRTERDDAYARLQRWTASRDGDSWSLATRLPEWQDPQPIKSVEMLLSEHPEVIASEASIEAGDAAVNRAREARKPGWAVELRYGLRDGQDTFGRSRPDFLSLAFTTDLRIRKEQRQDQRVAAQEFSYQAAIERRENLVAQLRQKLASETAELRHIGMRLDLYRQRLQPQTGQLSESSLSAYRNDDGDFNSVVMAFVAQLDLKLELARLEVDRLKSIARLRELLGEDLS
jgi:outer membrane protein TolC